jgi:hypothetical protein
VSRSGARRLVGNGAELACERALAARVQGALERVYQLERVADVGEYLRSAEAGEREALLLREADDGALEVTLRLPRLASREETAVADSTTAAADRRLDGLCQIIEGVSHFVYVVERARRQRATTHLELEVQAEVDKWVVLADCMHGFDARRSAELRAQLYENVSFQHDGESEMGERYRVANDTAHAFIRKIEGDYVESARYGELRAELRRFFHVGQEEKLRLGRERGRRH